LPDDGILPIHRLEKINNIGGKAPVIVVSTQLIEAGVDISLDVVFRDFAPLRR
jgi:CRISPR-associated endonuclease/helicase Cas3